MDWKLESRADELLAEYRETCTTNAEKTETLTEAQMRLRYDKEVYNSFGLAEASLFSGIYGRAFNPEFGQRPSRHRRADD
jgi:hypothetical protein